MIAPVAALVLFWPAILLADYTLVLKNGRRITVQTYRAEGQMIKAYGLGGEIGIPRDQIQSIFKAGEEGRGMDLRGEESAEAGPAEPRQGEERQSTPAEGTPPDDKLAEERAKEEKEYQKRVKEITEQIKATRDRYSLARGTSSSEPGLLESEEAIRARTDDLNSRLRDQQHNPAGPSDAGSVKLSTPSPFTGAPSDTLELRPGEVVPRVDSPPPAYSGKERELSDLRNRVNQLTKERERLIEEMKRKNFETGSLFLD